MPVASVPAAMLPFHPPFPLASKFPFHVAASGSHNSILMTESGDGFIVAATRQNAGRSENDCACFPCPVEGSAPAATARAEVMVVSGKLREARLSHVAAEAVMRSIPRVRARIVVELRVNIIYCSICRFE